MQICGFQKTTLLDYPSHLAATIFLGGCNFCCPFCHNTELIRAPFGPESYSQEEILSYLKKRASVLEGVCITGGEPTLNRELPAFIHKIKELGLLVKLDSNGSNPQLLKSLYEDELIDYVAMDIKSGLTSYHRLCGLSYSDTLLESIKASVHFLIHETNPERFCYEFRTTVVKPLHTRTDFEEIAVLIEGASHYYLQNFRECDNPAAQEFSPFCEDELKDFMNIIKPFVSHVSIRSGE